VSIAVVRDKQLISAKALAKPISRRTRRPTPPRGTPSEKLNRVCLGGGTFQNVYLLTRALAGLRGNGFEVFLHSRGPPMTAASHWDRPSSPAKGLNALSRAI
jgi:hypothetical protein